MPQLDSPTPLFKRSKLGGSKRAFDNPVLTEITPMVQIKSQESTSVLG